VDQPEVDRPGVDGKRVDGPIPGGRAQAVEHVRVQAQHVPVQPAADPNGDIGEAPYLVDHEPLAVEEPERDAAALGAQVDGGERPGQFRPSSVRTARRRSRGRTGGGSCGPGSQTITWTPAARQASTSSAGALESVTMPARSSIPTNESN